MSTISAPYTAFGKTRMVPVRVCVNGQYVPELKEWDIELWVERGEDLYALAGPPYRGKHVRIVESSAFRAAPEVEPDPCAGCVNRDDAGVYAIACLGCMRYTGGKYHKDLYEVRSGKEAAA